MLKRKIKYVDTHTRVQQCPCENNYKKPGIKFENLSSLIIRTYVDVSASLHTL